jgi:hypothetical protein
MVSRDAKEYLEINLKELHVITGCRTQGRFGNGQGQEYAEEYMIEYWRPNFTKWIRWKNHSGKEVRLLCPFSFIKQKVCYHPSRFYPIITKCIVTEAWRTETNLMLIYVQIVYYLTSSYVNWAFNGMSGPV